MAHVPGTNHASAAAACLRSAGTAISPVTWTAASSTPAASRPTAWRSAWSAAASASPLEDRHSFSEDVTSCFLAGATWINLDQCGATVFTCCSYIEGSSSSARAVAQDVFRS